LLSQDDPLLSVRIALARFLFTLGLAVSAAAFLLSALLFRTFDQVNVPAVGAILLTVSVTGLAFACVCGPIWGAWALRQWVDRRRAHR
jgi:hypothetical protein